MTAAESADAKPAADAKPDVAALEKLVAEADTGGRDPKGAVGKLLLVVAVAWSAFQIWYASPLPFLLRFGVLNDTEARSIHFGFAMFLAFTCYPALKRSRRDRIPIDSPKLPPATALPASPSKSAGVAVHSLTFPARSYTPSGLRSFGKVPPSRGCFSGPSPVLVQVLSNWEPQG